MKNRWFIRVAALSTCALGIAAGLPPAFADPPVHVYVDTFEGYVARGTTVGRLLDLVNRHPRRARLLSVSGKILAQDGAQGYVTVNGVRAGFNTPVEDDAHIHVVDARDVTEPVERTVAPAVVLGNSITALPPFYEEPVEQMRGVRTHQVVSEAGRETKHPAIALTFDDGPTPQWTLKILAVLRTFKIKATFFEIGQQVAFFPKISAAIVAAGMPIEDHTWSHPNMRRLSKADQYRQMWLQVKAVRDNGFPMPKWFRPPYGSYNATTVAVASSLGMRTILWTDDPRDWSKPGASSIIRRVLAQVSPGGVILLHDGGGDRSETLAALPVIIATILARGYRFVTLD